MSTEFRPIRVAIGRLAAEPPRPMTGAAPNAQPQALTPLIDIHEGSDGLILEADLPGVAEDSVSIQLQDNVLSLQAKVEPAASNGARLIHQEYRVAEFQRSFILSDEVDRSGITAELKNGVLKLVLPKAERTKSRRIEIKAQS